MDKHGIAALLIGKPVEKPEEEAPESSDDTTLGAHLKNAGHELMDAIGERDVKKLVRAFCTMCELAEAKSESGEPDDEDEEPEEDAAETD